jgi:D-alanine transaminase
MPVVQIDGAPVGTGKPGKIAARLRDIYIDEMRKAAV